MNPRLSGILIACAVILADQMSKWYVVTQYFGFMDEIDFAAWLTQSGEQAKFTVQKITEFLNIVMVWNPGVSFGMLQTDKNYVGYGLIALAFVVSAGFLVWLWRDPRPFRALVIGLITGGALGNVLDRLRFGAVADFIDIHLANYHWPAFNIADAGISIGITLLLIETVFFEKSKK